MKEEMRIVRGEQADIDGLERLYDGLNDYLESHVNYPGWRKGIYPIREDAEDGVRSGTLYLARCGGEIAGSIILNHVPEKAPEHGSWMVEAKDEEVLAVHTFVVNPLFMRKGVGKALLDFADEKARELRMKALRLDVYEKNFPAIRLYEKCGYRYIDTVDIGLGRYGLDWFKLYEKLV